jgi:hypothetical protein
MRAHRPAPAEGPGGFGTWVALAPTRPVAPDPESSIEATRAGGSGGGSPGRRVEDHRRPRLLVEVEFERQVAEDR